MRFGLALVVTSALVAVTPSTAAAPPAKQIASLKRQVAALKATNAKLKAELNATRASLSTAQAGVLPAISTMSAYQLADTILPSVFKVFDTTHTAWQSNYKLPYASGTMSRTTNGDGSIGYSYIFDAC